MKIVLIPALTFVALLGAGLFAIAQTPAQPTGQVRATEGAGSTIFGNYCETCHGNPKVASAPAPAILKQMSPERIYLALTKGDMVTMAQNLTDVQKRDIAEWVGGRPLRTAESGDAQAMSNACSSNPPMKSLT